MNIALVGNAPKEKHEILNSMLREEDLTDLCSITLYGADGQPELEALRDAIEDCRKGQVQGIVCLPMQMQPRKAVAHAGGGDAAKIVVTRVMEKCRVMSVRNMTQDDIIQSATQLADILKRDLSVQNPRIAVLSYNDNIQTDETSVEITTIAPAVSELVKNGIQVFGPLASGTFFKNNDYTSYDAVIVTNEKNTDEDLNDLTTNGVVTILSGTDIPTTSAEAEDILHAIFTTIDIIRNRQEYDLPFANPLQKMYHERKEAGDKTRFTVKKKGFNPAEHRRENVTYIS
jgi:4-hydroxy-L-threonine phosphate dehydrogenase PdxA